jgi:protein-S-isoprenylcysteine O-methyltransferase Ste14
MDNEHIFRLTLLASVTMFVVAWLGNLVRTRAGSDTFYAPTEGPVVAIVLRSFLIASLVGIIAHLYSPISMPWAIMSLPVWLRWLGVALSLPALLLFLWVLWALGPNFSTSLVVRNHHTLVMHGPYRWVRHPMYGVFCLLWLAFMLLSANWFIGVTGLAAYGITMAIRTPSEETMMLERFGNEYRRYMERTGRFLPRWSKREAT